MQAYGRKKGRTHVAGHQNCGDCHPVQKNKTARARRAAKEEIAQEMSEDLFLYIANRVFRCCCGCNLFRKISQRKYQCNACHTVYVGDQ